jgi:serine/threonine-protein kinase
MDENQNTQEHKPETPPEKKKKVSLPLQYAAVIGGFIIFLFLLYKALDSWIIPSYVHDRESVIIPEVIGKDFDQAKETILRHNLKATEFKREYNTKYEKGIVVKQTPAAGKSVKRGRLILLTISRGKETVPMPELKGKTLRQARVTLMKKGLNMGNIQYEHSEEFFADTVVAQTPRPGRKVPYGEVIDLVVSKGSEKQVKVPFVIGLTLDEAIEKLRENNLRQGNITYFEDKTFLPGTVTEQFPEANQTVQYNSEVNMTVTK